MKRHSAKASTASRKTPYATSALPIGTGARLSARTCAPFIDKGLTAHHEVVEYLDSPSLKVFHGKVTMTFDDANIAPVMPTMTHFFYMDEAEPSKVAKWIGSVGPTGF
jgi:hypothetical protein